MPRPPINWLITDMHLYHDAMWKEFKTRPPDFTDQIIKNLRRMLTPQDTLYDLGDSILYKYTELKGILDSISGRKVLVMGNHDRKTHNWYMRHGYSFAGNMIVLDDVLLSHRPVRNFPDGVRLNVHGHWHDDEHRVKPEWWSPTTHRVLAIENTNYCPVKLTEFVK
jgi:calcineurin-like phosphoesterase family protein